MTTEEFVLLLNYYQILHQNIISVKFLEIDQNWFESWA